MNTITIELCAEDRARLEQILEALGRAHPNCQACATSVAGTVAELARAPKTAEQPEAADAKPAEANPPKTEPQVPQYTLDDIRQKVAALIAADKREQASRVVKEYAPNVSGLANCPDKWPEIMQKLNAAGGEA